MARPVLDGELRLGGERQETGCGGDAPPAETPSNPFLAGLNEPIAYGDVTAEHVTAYGDIVLERSQEQLDAIKAVSDPTLDSVVVPFDDLSGDPEEQYFVSGMQSALIDGLSRVRNLRVTSKVSTLPYRQGGSSLIDIAMQLGVARIIEGTVLRADGRGLVSHFISGDPAVRDAA